MYIYIFCTLRFGIPTYARTLKGRLQENAVPMVSHLLLQNNKNNKIKKIICKNKRWER